MEFFINKKATLPVLKMELINDGKNDFNRFYEAIQNADVTFTMTNLETGIVKVGKRIADVTLVDPCFNCLVDEYHLSFQFTTKDTDTAGRYIGKFEINFLDGSGKLIVPIHDQLFINILEGSIKK